MIPGQTNLFYEGPTPLVVGPVFLVFELRGPPRHKARHRSRIIIPKDAWTFSPRGRFMTDFGAKKIFIQQYADPETAAYEAVLAEAGMLYMRGKRATEAPVALLVHVFKPIPESWSKKDKAAAEAGAILPTSRPDGDNYLKAVQDGLNGIVWADDSQICDSRVIKRYSTDPALRVEVREFIHPTNRAVDSGLATQKNEA